MKDNMILQNLYHYQQYSSIIIKAMNKPFEFFNSMNKSLYLDEMFQFIEKKLEQEFCEQSKQFDILNDILVKLQKQMAQKLEEYKEIQTIIQKEKENFFVQSNYQQFFDLIYYLQDLDEAYQSDEYTQAQKQLAIIIDEMLANIYNEKQQTQQNIVRNKRIAKIIFDTPNFSEFESSILNLFQQQQDFIQQLNLDIVKSAPQLLQKQFGEFLENKIQKDQKKIIKKLNLIYKGSRDGLNAQSFWSRINGKKNLLMIFQSGNQGNNILGAYSPCLWQSQTNSHVSDETLTSFLFSQNLNQIYPLKKDSKYYAIFCDQRYGPTFGYDGDLFIGGNFVDGFSNLGQTYQWDKYKNQKNEILFGGPKPNLSECEIIEIIFK